MSILLEALKKSEKSRQLGETPTLYTQVERTVPMAESSASLVPILLVMLSVIVMAWFGWQQFTAPEPVDSASEAAMVAERPAHVAPGEDPVKPAARTMTEEFQQEPASRAASESGESAEDEQRKQELKQSFDRFVAEPESKAATEAPEPAADAQAEALASAVNQPSEKPAEELSEEQADEGLKPHIAEPISYWELPQGVRDTLPEIKITVLVFAEEPENRFLLTNGQRLVEKDELDDGLVLDEIRRDGAIFMYRKYRFLVKG